MLIICPLDVFFSLKSNLLSPSKHIYKLRTSLSELLSIFLSTVECIFYNFINCHKYYTTVPLWRFFSYICSLHIFIFLLKAKFKVKKASLLMSGKSGPCANCRRFFVVFFFASVLTQAWNNTDSDYS